MCGIVALVNTNNEPGNQNIVRAMADKISHRGPDAEGYWTHKNVAFGHRRLSIIDLTDAGSQPMQTEDGRYTICYNGELYNFMEIKLELQASGETFVSRSDTEVLLKAVAKWGISKAMSRFNGIIAFVLYDSKKHQLHIARDRYGIKPLYYCKTKTSILFASEVKAFAEHPNAELRLDPEGVVEYFTFQNFLSERTLFKDVKMFPAGHYATFDCASDDEVMPIQYWDFDFREPTNEVSEKEMLQELRFLFEKAVTSQLVSDVDVSSYLSGGMDSGSITAVAAKTLPFIRTFTCGFDLTSASGVELNFDERKVAEKMSYLFKTEHYAVCLKSGDMQRAVPDLVYHLDEPRVGQSYPNYYVAGLASKFGKVVLGGTGGDEIFGGYPWRYYNVAGARSKDEFAERYFKFWQRLVPLHMQKEVFAPIWSEVRHVDPFEIFKKVFYKRDADFTQNATSLNMAMYFEAKTFLHGLLVVEDKISMTHSLESRVPFLDNDLVDFAMQIPASARVKSLHKVAKSNIDNQVFSREGLRQYQKTNDGKILLRKMMSGLLPKEIIEAQKQGFSAPDASWFRGESIDFVRDRIGHGKAAIWEIMDFKAMEPLLDRHFGGAENNRLLIWSLLNVDEAINQHGL